MVGTLAYISGYDGGLGVHDSLSFPHIRIKKNSDKNEWCRALLFCTRNTKKLLYNFDVQEFRSHVMCRHAAEGFQILANTWQCFSALTSKVFFLMQWIMMKALRPFKCSSWCQFQVSSTFLLKGNLDQMTFIIWRGTYSWVNGWLYCWDWEKEGQHKNQTAYKLPRPLQVGDIFGFRWWTCVFIEME